MRLAHFGPIGLLLIVLVTGALPARAEGPGVIAGQIVNGTAGGNRAAGAPVTLHSFRGEAHEADREARADDQGGFRFAGLDVGESLTFQVSGDYAGVTYGTEPIQLTAETPEKQIELKIYETTATDPGLRASQALLVLGGIDRERQEIPAMELVVLTNPSDRVFAASPGGAAGPMGLVRFGLPPGARDLQPSLGLDPAQVMPIDRGFATTTPMPPGDHELGYAYRLPYAGDRYVVEKSLTYGAGLFRLLVPEGDLEVASPDLSPGEPANFGGTRYRVWVGQNLRPGTRLFIALRGLPTRPFWQAALDVVANPVVAPTALALAFVVGAIVMLRARRTIRADDRDGPGDDRGTLLAALADLDDAFAAGQLAEALYQERRAALKARLRALLAG